ncbi:MAG: threonine--tRNA ligase [Spirochaetaceae bacterium]|nr:MAG: threonine--tRNA ligase [Spirochaetaceae bacterium]
MAEATALDQRNEKLLKIRHSTAHVMAEAVLEMFPGTKLAIGPPIEDGFYYDFDLSEPLKAEDLETIEKRMREIIAGNHSFSRRVVTRKEALKMFSDQPYKLELIRELPAGDEISLYSQDTFTDLCRGPHVGSTGELHADAFKLLSIAGAYWRGHERNPMLTRIYGTVWESRKELEAYLKRREEIEKRDHRRLGKDLDLYSTHEEAGAGLIYWHPKGALIRHLIEDYWKKEHFKHGYQLINTPHIGKSWLWETSGHLDFYKENMYAPLSIDETDYYLKPMNCPFHIMIYKSSLRSYRELPLRWAELGTVYRYERSGVLHGLLRVRGFTQDDAHIFCTPEQIEEEIHSTLRFSLDIWKAFGFADVKAYLATRPGEKSVGEPKRWEQATQSLKKAIDREALEYELDEGGGAFYGPKIDLKVKDSLRREWQMTTIQFDFNLPERFDMTYAADDGSLQRPYMVHRALLGSLERFFGVLSEHYGGAFPVWLAPVQAVVIPVAPAFNPYAEQVARQLGDRDVRISTDLSDQRMNAKIRSAQNQKIPYMIILGEKERASGNISLRTREGEQRQELSIEKFLAMLHDS